MSFKLWLNYKEDQPDAYESFIDLIFVDLQEGYNQEPINLMAEFVLTEAKTPWGSEKWLDGDENPKIAKTKGVSSFKKEGKKVTFETYIINLLPARQSGINVCMCASKECAATCLHTSGNIGALADKTLSRARKTWMLAMDRERAFKQIANQIAKRKKEIDEFNNSSEDEYKQLAIRLNGTSDIIWRALRDVQGKNIFDMFPDIIFYDYSKQPEEMESFSKGVLPDGSPFPSNYHLTFSYNGRWNASHGKTLENGKNLTVAFSPGKTSSLDYMTFPQDMGFLLRNLMYPKSVVTTQDKKDYLNKIVDKLIEDGNFVSKEDLAPFANQSLLPGLFQCHEVIDGDEYDARFLDDFLYPHTNQPNDPARPEAEVNADYHKQPKKKHGVIIGLVSKGDLSFRSYDVEKGWNQDYTGFMVGPNDPGLDYNCDLKLNEPSRTNFLKKKTDIFRKIARAIMTIRNFDARHVHGKEQTHIQKNPSSTPVQTYQSSQQRTRKEMNELIQVIQAVLQGEKLDIPIDHKRRKRAATTADKLRSYLMDPKVQEKLKDPEFIAKARQIGMDVNFESLVKMVQNQSAGEPKLTILPTSVLQQLGSGSGFKEWIVKS